MPRSKFSATDLTQLRRQLNSWRQAQSQRTRLPEEVWTAAAMLATIQGVSFVARSLGLDYLKLKRRVTPPPDVSARTTAPPAFVELQLDAALSGVGRSCRIELTDPSGGKLTMDLPCDASTVLGLAQAFWRRG